jgi:hypothetical protein
MRALRGHRGWIVAGGRSPGSRAGAVDGRAPIHLVAGYATAARIARPAPGEVRVVARVLPHAAGSSTAGISRAGIVRRCCVISEREQCRPGRPVAGIVLGAHPQIVGRVRWHGRGVVTGGRPPGGRSAAGRGAPVDLIPGHLAAARIARPAPGKVRVVARVLTYPVFRRTAGIGRAGIARRGAIVHKSE